MSNPDLADYTKKELLAELYRRDKIALGVNIPEQLPSPDWSPVIAECDLFVSTVWQKGWKDGGDSEYYIFEATLQALYGKDIFDKLNERTEHVSKVSTR